MSNEDFDQRCQEHGSVEAMLRHVMKRRLIALAQLNDEVELTVGPINGGGGSQ